MINYLSEVISSHLTPTSTITKESGGKRTRTADFCRAKAALYQLSYTPSLGWMWAILDLNQGPHPYQGCALTT